MDDIRKILHDKMEGFNYMGWVADNFPQKLFYIEGRELATGHIAHCLELLVDEFLGKGSHEGFVEALSKEDYKEALMLADDINSVAIKMYAVFISTFVPRGLIREGRS